MLDSNYPFNITHSSSLFFIWQLWQSEPARTWANQETQSGVPYACQEKQASTMAEKYRCKYIANTRKYAHIKSCSGSKFNQSKCLSHWNLTICDYNSSFVCIYLMLFISVLANMLCWFPFFLSLSKTTAFVLRFSMFLNVFRYTLSICWLIKETLKVRSYEHFCGLKSM